MTTTSAYRQPERSFQDAVTAYMRLTGWRFAHFRAARTIHGWRTPLTGDSGHPDIVAVRRDRLVYAELKSETGRAQPEQLEWLAALRVAGAECYLWRPADWDEIEDVLR
jgi:hypothetical protein